MDDRWFGLGDRGRYPAKPLCPALNDQNPYRSPIEPQFEGYAQLVDSTFVRGTRRGPALYIMTVGLLLTAFSPMLLIQNNPIGFALPFLGCSLGGLIFRFRSKHWPEDPNALKRVLLLSGVSLLLFPGCLVGFFGAQHQGFGIAIIVFVVGLSVVAGFALSGVRRHGTIEALDMGDGAG